MHEGVVALVIKAYLQAGERAILVESLKRVKFANVVQTDIESQILDLGDIVLAEHSADDFIKLAVRDFERGEIYLECGIESRIVEIAVVGAWVQNHFLISDAGQTGGVLLVASLALSNAGGAG